MEEVVNFNLLESYINLNKSKNAIDMCFSPKYYKKEREAYEKIFREDIQQLIYFAYSHYRSYFYYKSKNNKVYMFEINLGEIEDYVEIINN
jgi:hypothetical protein